MENTKGAISLEAGTIITDKIGRSWLLVEFKKINLESLAGHLSEAPDGLQEVMEPVVAVVAKRVAGHD